MTIQVWGYHGTSAERAGAIMQNGFKLSRNDYDWLGSGVYFWQDAPLRAWDWAKKNHEHPAVIRSSIVMEEEKSIDLLDIGWFEILSEQYSKFVEYLKYEKRSLPPQPITSKRHLLDREFLDYVCETLGKAGSDQIHVIRAAFTEGNPIFNNSAIFNLSHVQIAVKNTQIIESSEIIKRRIEQ
jgi:hypothetical protein